MGFEEPGGQQEGLLRRVPQPSGGALDDVLAERVGHVVLVEPQPRRERRLVLHSEKRCVPTRFGQQLRQRANARPVLPAVVGQPDQAVALRVAPGEQRAARRRAQRRGGMGAGEQDALGGESVQPWAGHVGVTVGAEIAAEVVPVHDQHVVALRARHVASFITSTPNRPLRMSATVSLIARQR